MKVHGKKSLWRKNVYESRNALKGEKKKGEKRRKLNILTKTELTVMSLDIL